MDYTNPELIERCVGGGGPKIIQPNDKVTTRRKVYPKLIEGSSIERIGLIRASKRKRWSSLNDTASKAPQQYHICRVYETMIPFHRTVLASARVSGECAAIDIPTRDAI